MHVDTSVPLRFPIVKDLADDKCYRETMDLSIIACCGHPTNASRSSVFMSLFKNLQLVELFLSNIGFFLANDTRPSPLQCEGDNI